MQEQVNKMFCGTAHGVGQHVMLCGTACCVGQHVRWGQNAVGQHAMWVSTTTGAQFFVGSAQQKGQHALWDSILGQTEWWNPGLERSKITQAHASARKRMADPQQTRSKRKQAQASAVGHTWFPEHPSIALLVL